MQVHLFRQQLNLQRRLVLVSCPMADLCWADNMCSLGPSSSMIQLQWIPSVQASIVKGIMVAC